MDAEARYEALVIPDIQAACDALAPAYVSSAGETGYVSLEVSPALAHDTAGTLAAALRLRQAVARDNLLIKVPATAAGVQAFEQLTAAGVSCNVTLIFSLAQYETVAQAYLRGAQRWLDSGGDARSLRSVASVFLSRVDTLVDQRIDAIGSAHALALRGKPAWPSPNVAISAIRNCSMALTSPPWRWPACAGKHRCGPAPAPRIRTTAICFTWSR
jgi:transaldolase